MEVCLESVELISYIETLSWAWLQSLALGICEADRRETEIGCEQGSVYMEKVMLAFLELLKRVF